MKDSVVFLIIMPVSIVVGAIIGFLVASYISKKQFKELQKQMEEPDKEQVRNMLSALGKKPSEEQVNRFISMAKNSAKKNQNDSKKSQSKKKK